MLVRFWMLGRMQSPKTISKGTIRQRKIRFSISSRLLSSLKISVFILPFDILVKGFCGFFLQKTLWGGCKWDEILV